MTQNGIVTINYVPKHFKFEMLDLGEYDNVEIMNFQYSSDFYREEDKQKISDVLEELKPQIIQKMKFYIDENAEFYKNFDFDFHLISDYAILTPAEINRNEFFCIKWDWILVSKLKTESLKYLRSLTHEQKRFAYGY